MKFVEFVPQWLESYCVRNRERITRLQHNKNELLRITAFVGGWIDEIFKSDSRSQCP
jgi:hypothetical protein